jgi:hypothetical protein
MYRNVLPRFLSAKQVGARATGALQRREQQITFRRKCLAANERVPPPLVGHTLRFVQLHREAGGQGRHSAVGGKLPPTPFRYP